jgi:diaminopimelate decarboxylase
MSLGLGKIRNNLKDDPNRFETPCYVYDVDAVLENYTDLRERLGTPVLLSLKANPCVDLLLRIHHLLADGIEVASLGELRRVVGSCGGNVFLNSPAYDLDTIRAAVASKATLVVDNRSQLAVIGAIAAKSKVRAIILRVNSSVLSRFGVPQARADHFGLQWEDFCAAIHEVQSMGLPLSGFHVFRGSYSFSEQRTAYVMAIDKLIEVFSKESGALPAVVNVGGGIGERWRESNIDFKSYRDALSICSKDVQLVHEAGRAVFGSAGYFLTRVQYMKRGSEGWVAVCDGGISHDFLLCNTEGAFRRYQTPHLLAPHDASREPSQEPILVVGPSCSRDDVIAKLPAGSLAPEPDDIFAFDHCGAYHHSYSVSRFLSLSEAREYVV